MYSMLMYFLNGYSEYTDVNEETENAELSTADEFDTWFTDCQRKHEITDYYCNSEVTFGNAELYQWVDEILQRQSYISICGAQKCAPFSFATRRNYEH